MVNEEKYESRADRIEHERQALRRLIGVILFPIALFPLLAMVTYNWRDISWLNSPPLSPPANLVGTVGAWSVFIGYHVFGVAVWTIPFFALVFSALLIYGKIAHMVRRLVWVILLLVSLCGLVQLGSETIFDGVLDSINMKPNAGGAIGYFLMTCFLTRWFSPFGGGVLVSCVLAIALIMVIGVRNLLSGFGLCTGWWTAWLQRRAKEKRETQAREVPVSADPDDGLSPRERELKRQQQIRENARRAQEEARRIREEERLRERQAKQREQQRIAPVAVPPPSVKPSTPPPVQPPVARAVPPVQPPVAVSVPTKKAAAVRPAAVEPTPAPAVQSVAIQQLPCGYELPPINLLDPLPTGCADHGNVEEISRILVDTLAHQNIPVTVLGYEAGPIMTRYELRPEPHIKVERVSNLRGNLQMALAAENIRIEAPIPGKNAIGIEVPNLKKRPVTFREIVEGDPWRKNRAEIPLGLGKDVSGRDLIVDLAKAPHLLVAGATGSGKSVCLNVILAGLLMSRSPEDLRLILVDPKRVEFTAYNDLPHLLVPVINDPNRVAFGLRWAILEMDRRYKLLQKEGCRNIVAFNNRKKVVQSDLFGDASVRDSAESSSAQESTGDVPDKMPYIVIVVDEVADIMAAVGKQVEPMIARLTSLSRAVGIHLVLATQRPSVDVITGTIKSNIPGRIAFKVAQANDSRTILDNPGAEELLGKGDLLFLKDGSTLIRAQCAWVSDEEIERVVAFVKERYKPCYDLALSGKLEKVKEVDPESTLETDEEAPKAADSGSAESGAGSTASDDETLVPKALQVIKIMRRASTSLLQRKLGIGYVKASRLMDILEARGIVGPQSPTGARELLVSPDSLGMDEAPPQLEGADEFTAGNAEDSEDEALS